MNTLSGNSRLALNAHHKVVVSNLNVEGTKASTNDKISLDCESLVISNCEILNGCTAYNVFEQKQTVKHALKSVYVKNVKCDCPTLLHNIFNFYNLADNCEIFIEDCEFNLNVANSNIMRLSNYQNAKSVTIRLKNIKWTYEPTGGSEEDFQWAGLILYQPANAKENAYVGSEPYTELRTWNFIFDNCLYNGEKVTENNFGSNNQVMIMYNMGKSGKVTDPVADGNLHLTFY